jgi:hypothetical protein
MCLYASESQETRSEGLESSVKGAATGSDCSGEGGPLGLGSLDEVLDGHLMGKAQRKRLVLRASVES